MGHASCKEADQVIPQEEDISIEVPQLTSVERSSESIEGDQSDAETAGGVQNEVLLRKYKRSPQPFFTAPEKVAVLRHCRETLEADHLDFTFPPGKDRGGYPNGARLFVEPKQHGAVIKALRAHQELTNSVFTKSDVVISQRFVGPFDECLAPYHGKLDGHRYDVRVSAEEAGLSY